MNVEDEMDFYMIAAMVHELKKKESLPEVGTEKVCKEVERIGNEVDKLVKKIDDFVERKQEFQKLKKEIKGLFKEVIGSLVEAFKREPKFFKLLYTWIEYIFIRRHAKPLGELLLSFRKFTFYVVLHNEKEGVSLFHRTGEQLYHSFKENYKGDLKARVYISGVDGFVYTLDGTLGNKNAICFPFTIYEDERNEKVCDFCPIEPTERECVWGCQRKH